jgi:hypothetical protein
LKVSSGWEDTDLTCSDRLSTSEYSREVNPELAYYPHFTYGRVLDLFKAIDSVALIWQFFGKKGLKALSDLKN